jgi:catechol 2,3-dioxygenase-like lactoylglutathione lyase family enzyme
MVAAMKLTFMYQPVTDIKEAVAFYRDTLGFDESWREGEGTVAFKIPGTEVELMLDVPASEGLSAGGFFEVDSLDRFIAEHGDLTWVGDAIPMPGGKAWQFKDPAGNMIYLFDQSNAEAQ